MAAKQVVRCNLFGSSYLVLSGEGGGVGEAGAAVGWGVVGDGGGKGVFHDFFYKNLKRWMGPAYRARQELSENVRNIDF